MSKKEKPENNDNLRSYEETVEMIKDAFSEKHIPLSREKAKKMLNRIIATVAMGNPDNMEELIYSEVDLAVFETISESIDIINTHFSSM